MTDQKAAKVWAMGQKEPGWYVAKLVLSKEYADHLETLGYRTMRSIDKPKA